MRRLCELAEKDDRICLVVGDLGYSVVESFADRFPSRFVNAGIAEQNMVGLAVGWSLSEGKVVFVYSIANFPTFRCLEQVRNDICHHRANVKIIAVGGGLTYGAAGFSHHAIEDLEVMRALPGMTVAAPCDAIETYAIISLAASIPGPWYIRLESNRNPLVHEEPLMLEHGVCVPLNEPGAVVLIATGGIAFEALQASEALKAMGIQTQAISVPFLKPVDEGQLMPILSQARLIVTVEEHTGFGGLGSVISELVATRGLATNFHRFHLPEFVQGVGTQQQLRRLYGLDAASISRKIMVLLGN
jgi:transketolase